MDKKNIEFIELFSGIGAFTQAITSFDNINATCVYASDIDKDCVKVYKENYHPHYLVINKKYLNILKI